MRTGWIIGVALAASSLAASDLWLGTEPRVVPWSRAQPADRARLGVRACGVYSVSAEELAVALGEPVGEIGAALASTNLTLSCGGRPVAWAAYGSNLLFYGVAAASRHAPENVYWVAKGQGDPVPPPARGSGASGTNACFCNTVCVQGTNDASYLTVGTLTNVPSMLAFKLLTAGRSLSVTASVPHACAGEVTGVVAVALLSARELGADSHSARVSVNGAEVGTPSWSGEQYRMAEYPFSGVVVSNGALVVKVDNLASSGTSARFFWCRLSVTYPSRYRATDNILLCEGGAEGTVVADGFTAADLTVWDVTDSERPACVAASAAADPGNAAAWLVAFPCGSPSRRYVAFSLSAGSRRPSVRGACDGDGYAADGACDYVALIPPEGWVGGFREALRPLVDFRERQGLRTCVLDVEALYNRFSHGLADPQAIRQFCAVSQSSGPIRLRYLLLAGSGTLDYRHERAGPSDYGSCLIPTLVAGQSFESGEAAIAAVDQAFGDVTGDSAPEVAVGRLPTASTQELAVAVAKTLAYEVTAAWKGRAAVAADWDYTGDGDRLALELAAAGKVVRTFYPPTSASALQAVWQSDLQPDIQSGDGVFWFIGHSGSQVLGANAFYPLVKNSTLESTSWTRTPIAVLVGCHVNRWHSPAATSAGGASFAPFGVFLRGSGFAAALASTAYVADGVGGTAGEGQTFALFLAQVAATSGVCRVGDAVCLALRRLAAYVPPPTPLNLYPAAIAPERLQCLCLTGDPALSWRHDQSGTGTPSAWLEQYGLTAWDGDGSDADGDGFAAWREFKDGTRPDTNRLVIAACRAVGDGAPLEIGFECEWGRRYAVQWRPSLDGAAAWENAPWLSDAQPGLTNGASVPVPADGPVTRVYIPRPMGDARGFYRILRLD